MESPQIPVIEIPASIPEVIYREFIKGILPEKDYHTMTAAWVAENNFKYRPRYYIPLQLELLSYADQRIKSSKACDPHLSKKLNSWLQLVIKSAQDNESDLNLLNWCKEKTQEAGLKDHAEMLNSACERFDGVKFPVSETSSAKVCMKLDSDSMQRGTA